MDNKNKVTRSSTIYDKLLLMDYIETIGDTVIFFNANHDIILKAQLLDTNGNIHIETADEVYDGPANLLLKM